MSKGRREDGRDGMGRVGHVSKSTGRAVDGVVR